MGLGGTVPKTANKKKDSLNINDKRIHHYLVFYKNQLNPDLVIVFYPNPNEECTTMCIR